MKNVQINYFFLGQNLKIILLFVYYQNYSLNELSQKFQENLRYLDDNIVHDLYKINT